MNQLDIFKRAISSLPSTIVQTDVQGFKMFVEKYETRDNVISTYLMKNHVWEAESTALLRKVLKPGMAFLDVGAHFAYYSLLASDLIGPQGVVYAFEPSTHNYQFLVSNIALNDRTNIVPLPLPLWDSPAIVKFSQGGPNTGDTATHLVTEEKDGPIPTLSYASTLDLLFKPGEVSFIKTDCQDIDLSILKGGIMLLVESEKMMVLTEFGEVHKFPEFDALMKSLGYDYVDTFDNSNAFFTKGYSKEERTAWAK